MKSPAILCALILLHTCSVQSMSLNLGNIFQRHEMQRGTQQQSGVQQLAPVSNQPPPGTQEQKIEYEYPPQYPSESYSEYYRSESDPYLYNSSSDQDVQSESWNSSYESSNSSEPIETKQSVQNSTTTTTSTIPTSTQKEHSISDVDESHSNVDVKSTVNESSGGDKVVWSKMSSPPASSTTLGPIISAAVNATSDGEKEEVVLGTAGTTTEVVQKSIFQKSIEWVKDDYILSILVPVAAGVIFAVTVICTIALCKCCRRCCRRKRFRKKCLPDSVRNLSTSDRKRLLGDMSSDDEF